jgi:hypothetical protein
MGLRYRIPFKDCRNTSYEVRIYRNGYTGEVKELDGAPSCFVVSGTDEDFMYNPVRTSTATINVLDSDLLLDLYSINNQYAPVKFYKEGVLEWTGYIKPEQFTQPYIPNIESISVECVSALATLEHIGYKTQNQSGYITMMELIRYIISSANGEYRGVYLPWVYGSSSEMNGNVFEEIILCEENFTSKEMNLLEVLEAVCKFLNWTVYDIKGHLYFVDADWKGAYRVYDEALTNYTNANGNEVFVQSVGFNGSGSNTLDIVHGYNKASVKSINNVFDEVIQEEPFDLLEVVQTWEYEEGNFEDARRAVRRFKKPMLWEMFYYDQQLNPITFEQATQMDMNSEVVGCVELTENGYRVTESNGEWVPKETDFEWEDFLKVRYDVFHSLFGKNDRYKAFTVKGVNSVWKDGAFGLDMSLRYTTGSEMVETAGTLINTDLYFMLRIGDKYWNGTSWVDEYSKFRVGYNVNTGRGFQNIPSNKNANMPYKGLRGHVIELPNDIVLKGDLEFTMFINCPATIDLAGNEMSGYFIKDFTLNYVKKDGVNDEGENGDRVYENIVNETYMSEAEEIEFEIGSYNNDGATYSKALLGNGFLTNNLYCKVVEEMVRPEELLIRRIVNRYGVTKIKLTEALWMTDAITPITILTERTQPGKEFRMTSGTWDYEQCRLTVQIQEDAE